MDEAQGEEKVEEEEEVEEGGGFPGFGFEFGGNMKGKGDARGNVCCSKDIHIYIDWYIYIYIYIYMYICMYVERKRDF